MHHQKIASNFVGIKQKKTGFKQAWPEVLLMIGISFADPVWGGINKKSMQHFVLTFFISAICSSKLGRRFYW
jgi:hypothetical protein